MGSKDSESLANHEIVVVAVYLCRGATKPVDLEDVAMKANELAPGRFTWTKYKSQISLEHVRVYLSDAKKEKNGSYLTGSGDAGWMLTEQGNAFAQRIAPRFSRGIDLSRPRLTAGQKRWISRERSRLWASPFFEKARLQPLEPITTREAEQLFKLDDYVQGVARQRKIDRYLALLGDDPDLGEVVRAGAKQLRDSR